MFSDTDPPRAITFAPNVDAETYANPPPPLIDPPPSTLFPTSSSPEPTSPRRPSHSRKKPDDWIPRPPNAFILFRSEMVEQFIKSQHVPGDVEANHGNLSKIIGLCWRNLPFPERSIWEHKARLAQAAHKAQYPHYRFRPHTKGGGGAGGTNTTPCARRRVKEPPTPPDARRVAHIAGLLVDGVKGAKLARAVKKLDDECAPSVVEMRFDEPVTAEQFAADRDKATLPAPVGKKRRPKVQDVHVPQPDPIMFEPLPVVSYPDEQEQAWSPPPASAWSPTADDTGTWSSSPEHDTAAWPPAHDAWSWPQDACTPTTTTPPYYDHPHTPNYDPQTPNYDPQTPNYDPQTPNYDHPPHTPTYDPQTPNYDSQTPNYDHPNYDHPHTPPNYDHPHTPPNYDHHWAQYTPFPPAPELVDAAALSSPADTPQRSPALAPAYAYPPVDVYGGGFEGEMAASYVGGGADVMDVPVQCFGY